MVIMEASKRGANSTEDIWTPYKALHNTIAKFLAAPTDFPSVLLEENLKNFKQTFLNLLKNTVRTFLFVLDMFLRWSKNS